MFGDVGDHDCQDRAALVTSIKSQLEEHFDTLGLDVHKDGNGSKDQVRRSHSAHREDALARERRALRKHGRQLLERLAVGSEVDPASICPELIPVRAGTSDALLFRFATTIWSVPVSSGYGRRLRFLVVDRANNKLIGLFALGDPVFNLGVRDQWIGWTPEQRKEGLVHIMDAFVVGSIPPYSQLLGGKLVTALIGSSEVSDQFRRRYSKLPGTISEKLKNPRLALVTITSALGRSSIYNRVRLPDLLEVHKIGNTSGWGHFHIPDRIFTDMRRLLAIDGHPFANGHKYGAGPNWRMRVVKKSLPLVGLNERLMRHGIEREVYGMPLAQNWKRFLKGQARIYGSNRPSADAIAEACIQRWIVPRSIRRPDYRNWSAEDRELLFAPIIG